MLPPTRSTLRLALLCLGLTATVACVSPAGDTLDAKRASVRAMAEHVMSEAVAKYPELPAEIDAAQGYLVLDTGIFKTIVGHVGGYGLALDKRDNHETFVTLNSWTLGPLFEFGNGASVVVFQDGELMNRLLAGDWKFAADADLSFRFGDFGGDVSAVGTPGGMEVYRVFQTGVGINATIFWTRIKPDAELNQ